MYDRCFLHSCQLFHPGTYYIYDCKSCKVNRDKMSVASNTGGFCPGMSNPHASDACGGHVVTRETKCMSQFNDRPLLHKGETKHRQRAGQDSLHRGNPACPLSLLCLLFVQQRMIVLLSHILCVGDHYLRTTCI